MTPSLNEPQLDDAQQKETIKKEQSTLWLEEHADFVKAYNQTVAHEGLPLYEWKTF
jgi:post-segregation antitoxin (ccd killing protein)